MRSIPSIAYSVLLLVLGVASAPVFAQTGTLRGVVLEAGPDVPLMGANVVLEGTLIGTATGADGGFVLSDVPPGRYTLSASMVGFASWTEEVEVEAGATERLRVELTERPIEVDEIVVERIMMTGGRQGLAAIPGSAHYISPREIETFSYNDVGRVLRAVPGVYIQEEDGYGLRPNIGMRGTGVERSEKIAVMEDGVLIAPAPYAAPAAYYFPTMGRMQAVEVRKGSSQIKYGPYTTGGALNLISTQIPYQFSGQIDALAAENGERTVHANLGHAFERIGFLVETFQAQADGFKELDGGGATGFDKQDYLVKLRLNTRPNAPVYQALTFKAGWVDETSNETYLGLTAADFERTPLRRYAASQRDIMNTDQRQLVARHVIQPLSFLDVTTTLYHTTFARNWYKLDRVRAGTDGDRLRIASLLDTPDDNPEAYAILTGETSPNDNALEVKANNREYYATGAQTTVGLRFDQGALAHDLEVGLRLHRDQIDRFQWVDLYRMDSGTMVLTEEGTPGTESNRIETATAVASYLQYRLTSGALTVTPGLRYENIEIEREDYGRNDPERLGTDLATRSNSVDVWIPGVSVDYLFTPDLMAFAGVHKGFAPPGSREGTEPEASVNYELGLRTQQGTFDAQVVGFFNDYSNLLGADLAAAGGDGSGDQFNGGEVDVLGLEASLGYDFRTLARTDFRLPLTLTYTYTDATFQNGFESEFGPWGTVEPGDALPYIPSHQFSADAGIVHRLFSLNLGAKYVGELRTTAGQGSISSDERIDAHLILDLAADVRITRQVRLFSSIRNLSDEVYVVSRRPAGLRPGLPRTFQAGLKADF